MTNVQAPMKNQSPRLVHIRRLTAAVRPRRTFRIAKTSAVR